MTDDMKPTIRPAHSPLGASGAERWMNCPGSVTLLQHLQLGESDEADWTKEGTAAHAGAAHALTNGLDAWELVGETFEGLVLTAELADPIQAYLDYARSLGTVWWVEYAISSPVHPQFYGTLDLGCDEQTGAGRVIHVVDLKFGQGIMVDVEDNPQLKYYAFGLIDGRERAGEAFSDDTIVELAIVQPRGFHHGGPIRTWRTTVGEIKRWVHGTLVPAMQATEFDDRLTPGDWCRFCPAKLACPLLTALFQAAALANAKHIPDQSDAALGENYKLADAAKHYIKALEAETLARALRGRAVPHVKLVHKKANRVWKDGAAVLAQAKFGTDAFSEPALKSPAELEKLPAAATWVKEFAYTPDTGLTIALADDSRQEVIVVQPTERFSAVRGQLQASLAQDGEDW